MASNPMQRKARNSFLLGVIVTLLIASIIIGFLFMQLKQKTEELNSEIQAKQNIYVLTQDVKSGQVLTEDMFTKKAVNKNTIPSNATASQDVIDAWYLQTQDGTPVLTDDGGLYLDIADTMVEIFQNDDDTYDELLKDSDGNKIEKGEKYIVLNGEVSKVSSTINSKIIQDDYGAYYIDETDTRTRVFRDGNQYYIYVLDKTTMSTSTKRVKTYVEMNNVPLVAKIDMNKNTVITPNLVAQSNEFVTNDLRQQEYNMITLPVDLMTDDYIDIRLMTPSGQDFIVVSKAKVDIPVNADNTYVTDTIRINLTEDEILTMSSAIVEAYGLDGAKLYANKYVEAGRQDPSTPTYIPNAAVSAQIALDPNIVGRAKSALRERYTEEAKAARSKYLQSLIDQSDNYSTNIQSKQDEKITNQNSARQKYLESLN